MKSTSETIAKALGIRVIVDESEIVPSNPGEGQPVRVETDDGRFSASWNCATAERELSCGEYRPTPEQCQWIDSVEPDVDAWMREHGV